MTVASHDGSHPTQALPHEVRVQIQFSPRSAAGTQR